jgi:eukaryotic-like serine/threonine-protein kinase
MIPSRLGRYEILGELGRGAMGSVYLALDPIVGREVAVKTLRLEGVPAHQREELLRRFRREAQASGQLTHPNIVTIFDVGENFFVMELVRGETLQSYLSCRGPMEPEEMLSVVAPLAGALDYAHARGVVHRDVKPANIMMTARGVPKLMDFGLAHLEATVLTQAGQSLGSPAYMSPEQVQGLEPTPRADLYSLAVVSYEMLTGARPFNGRNITTLLHQVVHDPPVPPRERNGSLPLRYDELFERALSKIPEERFADAASFVTELNLKELEAIATLIDAPEPWIPPRALPSEEIHERETLATPAPIPSVGPSPSPSPSPSASATERRAGATKLAPSWRRPWVGVGTAAAALVLTLAGWLSLRATSAQVPLPVAVRVESAPAGAGVWLDGVSVGNTPLSLAAVATGEHEVTAVKEGFVSATERLTVTSGTVPSPILFSLQPARALLSLTSTPPSATVVVDGKEVGTTPIEELELGEGAHRVQVRHPGFEPWNAVVPAQPGESLQFVARLEPRKPSEKPLVQSKAPPPPPQTLPAIAEMGDPGIAPPRKIAGDFAHYPELARKRRLTGVVTVSMTISETGSPEEIAVVESAGDVLDEAVLKAIATWRFEPASRDGKPVAIHWQVRQHFRLDR